MTSALKAVRRRIGSGIVLALLVLLGSSAGLAAAAPARYAKTVTLGNGVTYTGAGQGGAVPPSPLIHSTSAGVAGADPAAVRFCAAGTLDPAKVAGKIVVCDAGTNPTTEKSQEVTAAGGVGMVLANLTSRPLTSDVQSVPTVHVDAADGFAIKAYVAGSANPTASLGAEQRVYLDSTTALSSSANPSVAGQAVTFTATVGPAGADPAGTVAFTDGGATLPGCGAVPLVNAVATCTASLSEGAHSIAATYSGDEGLKPSSATLAQQVDPAANRAPTARPDSYTTTKNRHLIVSAPGVLTNDTDADGDRLRVTRVVGPARGTLRSRSDGSFEYRPKPGFTGYDGFVYQVSDGRGGSTLAPVVIVVRAK